MVGNIVGQSLNTYVKDEIEIRQQTHGSGFEGDLRTSTQINYLNSRLSWVKMASSVEIVDKPSILSLETQPYPYKPDDDFSFFQNLFAVSAATSASFHGEGTKKLTKVLEENISPFQGIGLAKKAILFNGLTETIDTETSNTGSTDYNFRNGISTDGSIWNNGAYGLGGLDYGIQPMPGIIDINIDHLNRGSIRKATVKLKAYNKKQFEIIELLYLRLGYTMLLEWGNNVYLNKNQQKEDVITTLIDTYWFKDKRKDSHVDNLSKIEEYRKRYQGNYDGFFGRVSNFSWTFDSDGSYNITIDLMSLGDVIESLKINVYNLNVIKAELVAGSDSNQKLDKISDLLFSLSIKPELDSAVEKLKQKQAISFAQIKKKIKELKESVNPLAIESIKDYRNDVINLTNLINSKNKFYRNNNLDDALDSTGMNHSNFIRFGAFLSFLREHVILQITNDGVNSFPLLNINNEADINIMYAEPKQFGIDPRICIVKNNLLSEELENNIYFKDTTTSINNFNDLIPLNWLIKGNNLIYGNVMNIYLNFNFILNSLKSNLDSKGNLSIFNFLSSICKGINKNLGGVNNLEPIVDELTNSITILDQSVVPGKNEFLEENDPVLEIYGYNTTDIKGNSLSNFVKDFGFQTEITPELSTIIAIGASSNNEPVGEDATAFSKWNLGLEDRFNKKIFTPDSPDLSSKNKDKDKDNLSKQQKRNLKKEQLAVDKKQQLNNDFTFYLTDAFNGVSKYKGGNDVNNLKPKYLKLNEKFISRGQNVLKNNLLQDSNKEFEENNNPSPSIGFIPFNLSMTLDGISGIKIYNRLKINTKFLPSNYPTTLEFLVKKVSHSLSNNIWETKLETITVPKSSPKTLKSAKSLQTYDDSIPEFFEPIPGMELRTPGGGSGEYGASRDRGQGTKGLHMGMDLQTKQLDRQSKYGTKIFSPITGIKEVKFTKDKKFKKFQIIGTGSFKGIIIELAYVNPISDERENVAKGQPIGTSVNLQKSTEKIGEGKILGISYPATVDAYSKDIFDHVHYSVIKDGKHIDPTPNIGPIRYTNESPSKDFKVENE